MSSLSNIAKKISRTSLSGLWNYIFGPRRKSENEATIEILSNTIKSFDPKKIDEYRITFLSNHLFFKEINERMVDKRRRRLKLSGWSTLIYLLMRFHNPKVVVETGVFDGVSSALILQALADNGNNGKLISIDLPAYETIEGSTHAMDETKLPENCEPGWAIPDYLRNNHTLIFGTSQEHLPEVLSENKLIDIFFHDSLHTFENQMFEYKTAWPCVRKGGLLLSDDINWNKAFRNFCNNNKRKSFSYNGFGMVRK